MARKKHTYKEVKSFIKHKAAFEKEAAKNIGNLTDRRNFRQAVRKANFKTISILEQSYRLYTDSYINARMAFNNTATNMRQWAVIKRYYDLVDEGIIKPKFSAIDDYHEIYGYMENELSINEMKEIIDEAEAQTEKRRERLAQKTFDSPVVDFSEVIRLMEG